VKANESAVFDRVVNRTLYSKKIVVAIAFAFVMVSSAFVVSVSTRAGVGDITPSLKGWTLKPVPSDWVVSNIKGYCEGDVIPIRLTLDKPSGGDTTVVQIGFEYGLGTLTPGTPPVPNPTMRGFDRVVEYNYLHPETSDPSSHLVPGDPVGPYNDPHDYTLPEEGPFWADDRKGDLTQEHLDYSASSGRLWDSWKLTLEFSGSCTSIDIYAGGLLYVTTPSMKGASYIPGSSLHVRILDEQGMPLPLPGGGGSQDISINVCEILGKPILDVKKTCAPPATAASNFEDHLTFTAAIENDGQSSAVLEEILDVLPLAEVEYVMGSSEMWLDGGTHVKIPDDPADPPSYLQQIHSTGSLSLAWHVDDFPATGPLAQFKTLPGSSVSPTTVVLYLRFEVEVKTTAASGEYANHVNVFFTDCRGDDYDAVHAECPFWIVAPMVEIVKEVGYLVLTEVRHPPSLEYPFGWTELIWTWTDIDCAAGKYVMSYDSEGNPVLYDGDTVQYRLTVTNIGDEDLVAFEVRDPLLGTGIVWEETGIDLETGDSLVRCFDYDVTGQETEDDPIPGTNPVVLGMMNTANVKAKDDLGHWVADSSDEYLNILHPGVSLSKTVDRPIAAQGETITYTITAENQDPETEVDYTINDPMVYYEGALHVTGTLAPSDGVAGSGPDYLKIVRHYTVKASDIPTPDISVPIKAIENTVTLTGQAHHPGCSKMYDLVRSASASVQPVRPDIEVTKEVVDSSGAPKDHVSVGDTTVRYKITVENTGDVDLRFAMEDSQILTHDDLQTQPAWLVPTNLPDNIPSMGVMWKGVVRAIDDPLTPADDTKNVTYWLYTLTSQDPDPLTNLVWAHGWWKYTNPELFVSDDSSTSVPRYGALSGIVFADIYAWQDQSNPANSWPYGAYDGVRQYPANPSDPMYEEGLNSHLTDTMKRFNLDLWKFAGSYNPDGTPVKGDWVATTWSAYDSTYGDGYYKFDGLNAGDYVVEETIASGLTSTWFITQKSWRVVTVTAGSTTTEQNIGNAKFGYIESYKWLDWNHDQGVNGEYGLNGWTIHLKGTDYLGNPVPATGDSVPVLTTGTGHESDVPDKGWYKFDMLKPGIYEVWEVLDVNDDGVDEWGSSTIQLKPGDPTVSGPHYWNIGIESGTEAKSYKFGNYPYLKIWGIKFFDKDHDGTWDWVDRNLNGKWDSTDDGEPALNDWLMTLEWWNPSGGGAWAPYPDAAHQMTYLTRTDPTHGMGYFEFVNLPPNKYRVNEVLDTNLWEMTTPSVNRERVEPMPVTPAQPGPKTFDPVYVGNLRYAKIEGWKFKDNYRPGQAWPDGSFDRTVGSHEFGLPNHAITLEGRTAWGDRVVYNDIPSTPGWDDYAARTGDGFPSQYGWYSYAKVLPGTYWVNSTSLMYWVPTNASSVLITIPAYPLGPQIVMKVSFGVICANFDPEIPFVLKKGWNMWSTPVRVAGLTANGLLNAIGPAAMAISRYDTTQKRLVSYVKNAPVGDFDIVMGEGYQILMSSKARFTLVGDLVSSVQVSLAKGWNLIGYTSLEPMKASELLAKITGCTGMAITYTDKMTKTTWTYVMNAPAGDFNVVPGFSYNLLTNGPGMLTFA